MKIDGISLPIDWRELIEELVTGGELMLDDRSLQDALKESGYARTGFFRRGAIQSTDKLQEWWRQHKNDLPAKFPATFEEAWQVEYAGKLSGSGIAIELAFKEVAQKMWDAAKRAGTDID